MAQDCLRDVFLTSSGRSKVTEILERKFLDYREICGQIISNPNVWEISHLYMKRMVGESGNYYLVDTET